jgi:hypothetical protein
MNVVTINGTGRYSSVGVSKYTFAENNLWVPLERGVASFTLLFCKVSYLYMNK